MTDLDDFEFQNHRDGRTNFTLKAVHFKHATLANDLSAASITNSTQDASHRRRIDPGLARCNGGGEAGCMRCRIEMRGARSKCGNHHKSCKSSDLTQ